MNFSIKTISASLCFLLFVACGDDDGAVDAATPNDAAQVDARPRSDSGPDSGPTMSCTIDIDCPAGLVCDQTTFTCENSGPPACSFATCEDDIAASCEGDVVMNCADHGGSCSTFEADDGDYVWCDCGGVAEGQLSCTGERTGVFCVEGNFGQLAECELGTLCLDESDGVDEAGCYCDDIPDGICPDPGCVDDLDCADCTPSCGGGECGDNGCGGSCGSCGVGEACSEGRCVSGCAPRCSGRECGADGCGGTCGACTGGENCADGSCVGACTPNCSGRSCGSDGCGGSCGSCGGGESCSDGACITNCVPSCTGRECGSDGCGGSCGRCSSGESCESGSCVGAPCGSGGPCASPASCSSVSTGGERCSCFGDDERYTFDGSALDFSGSLRSARVRVRQIYENETSAPVVLESGNFRTTSTRVLIMGSACSANVEVTRIFSFVVDGSVQTCEIGPESYVGQTSFTLTMPSGVGSGCTAPRL